MVERGEKRGIHCKGREGTKEDSIRIKLMLICLTSDLKKKKKKSSWREREREQLPKGQDESKGP